MSAALSVVSRIDLPGVAAAMLFASGERLAIWSDEAPQVVDAATGRTIVTMASRAARFYTFELDGPLAIVANPPGNEATWAAIEVWDFQDGAPVATLLPAGRLSGLQISRSMIACLRTPPDITCVRFDRSGAFRDEVAVPAPHAPGLLVSTDGPKDIWNFGWRADELFDSTTGTCTRLEAGARNLWARPGHTHWAFDRDRAHLALYCGGVGRACVWWMSSGSLVRGPWEDRDLRDALFMGERQHLEVRLPARSAWWRSRRTRPSSRTR